MSKIENGALDQYGTEPFEQQQFGTAGCEGVKLVVAYDAAPRLVTFYSSAPLHRISLRPEFRHFGGCKQTAKAGQRESYIHRVSKNCAKLFLPELCQISTNFDNFWQTDGK